MVERRQNPVRVSRRQFLGTASGAALAASGMASVGGIVRAGPLVEVKSPAAENKPEWVAEDYVEILYKSLDEKQKKALCFSADDPLSHRVENNWHIVPERIGEFFNSDQQDHCRQILKRITTEDGYERFGKQMQDDDGGLEKYACAFFGQPGDGAFQWVLTGRHLTIRADGNSRKNVALGGPIFYGHAVSFNEKPDHPGNVWWHQARAANKVYEALDGKQRDRALLEEAPPDEPHYIRLRGDSDQIPGLLTADMSGDQRELLEETLKSLLDMFRESDVKEVMDCLKNNGGLDRARISFYKEGDIGDDGIWDRWRVEGPAFVWYFRGSPHVHTWVNVADRGAQWL